MPHPAENRAGGEGTASGETRAVLDGGHLDPTFPDGQDGLEQRLCQVVERLERMAGALDAMLDSLAVRPSADAAEALAREADHRLKDGLQTVIALLERQANRSEAETVRDALRLMDGRRAGGGRASR